MLPSANTQKKSLSEAFMISLCNNDTKKYLEKVGKMLTSSRLIDV